MQLTIYYDKDDEWLVEKLKIKAYAERRSVSQVIMLAVEEYLSKQEGTSPHRLPASQRKKKPKKRGARK